MARTAATNIGITAGLLLCLIALTACDGGAAKGREDGFKAGRQAGLAKGTEDGQRDGSASGREAGELRARHDAAFGLLPEIYLLPLGFAFVIGIAAGVWAQYHVLNLVRSGVQVPESLALATVPGLPRSRIYRAWKTAYGNAVDVRLRALQQLSANEGSSGSGRVIDVPGR